jgi:hypothetical protein
MPNLVNKTRNELSTKPVDKLPRFMGQKKWEDLMLEDHKLIGKTAMWMPKLQNKNKTLMMKNHLP